MQRFLISFLLNYLALVHGISMGEPSQSAMRIKVSAPAVR